MWAIGYYQIIDVVGIRMEKYEPATSIVKIKLELAKYYKDSEMTAFISERSRNSK